LCFFFQAEDGIRDFHVTGVQTCALPILVTTEFEAQEDGGTLIRMTVRFSSREARDAATRTGMATGMEAGYERLDGVLATREDSRSEERRVGKECDGREAWS